MTYDPELPAGFQDADLETAALHRHANRLARLRRRGICAHGWIKGLLCRDCGKTFNTAAELEAERRNILENYE